MIAGFAGKTLCVVFFRVSPTTDGEAPPTLIWVEQTEKYPVLFNSNYPIGTEQFCLLTNMYTDVTIKLRHD